MKIAVHFTCGQCQVVIAYIAEDSKKAEQLAGSLLIKTCPICKEQSNWHWVGNVPLREEPTNAR